MKRKGSPPQAVDPAPTATRGEIGLAKLSSSSSQEPREQPFGASLEPVMQRACDGQLSAITWFRVDWQRGGALTGYATFRDRHGADWPVVVKLPVPPIERLWLQRLQSCDGLVPKLYAHGDSLNGYDMVWVVMERVAHGPLGPAWGGRQFDLLAEVAGRFFAAAAEFPVDQTPPHRDWQAIFNQARNRVQGNRSAHDRRWNQALKKANRKLGPWLSQWENRCTDAWCHGDLHLANALTRLYAPAGPAVLIDFAQVHAGHWIEDAVYFEHLFWARRAQLQGRNLCSLIAKQRKIQGLPVERDWPQLASIHRTLLAVGTRLTLNSQGDGQHGDAVLEVLEAEVV